MAEQPSNLEMFDVLASIRRLVAEEQGVALMRGKPPEREAPAAVPEPAGDEAAALPPFRHRGTPAPSGRLVLTEELRVEGQMAGPVPALAGTAAEEAPDEAPVAGAPVPLADGGADADADGGEESIWAADDLPVAEAPAGLMDLDAAGNDFSDLDLRAASLEKTIAELEAAVASIGSEFEPDGGVTDDIVAEYYPDGDDADPASPAALFDGLPEAATATDPPADDAPRPDVAPFSPAARDVTPLPTDADDPSAAGGRGGVRGIMAGFDAMAFADEPLDAPITGEALIPQVPRFTPRPAPPMATETPDVDEAVELAKAFAPQADVAAPVPEVAGAADEDAEAERAADLSEWAAEAERAPLGAENGPGVDEAEGDEDAPAMPGAEAGLVMHGLGATEPEAVVDGPEAQAPAAPDADEAPERPRPRILRAPDPEAPADVEETAGGFAPHDAAADDDAPHDAPSAAAATPSPLERAMDEDLPDLFNPLATSEFDVDALRDIVAELVREELRGVLGERMTRNIRALVRAEIRRILEADDQA